MSFRDLLITAIVTTQNREFGITLGDQKLIEKLQADIAEWIESEERFLPSLLYHNKSEIISYLANEVRGS